ncbi:MAG: DNA alkylation repair protein [Christensenellales bacterium]
MRELETNIKEQLQNKAEQEYRLFSLKLTPTNYEILGVRMPYQKLIAREITKCKNFEQYLAHAAPTSFEELNVYGFAIAYAKVYDCDKKLLMGRYFSLTDNWASVDSIVCACKFVAKKPDTYYDFVKKLVSDDKTFVCRAGIVLMMTYYLTDGYVDDVLATIRDVKSDQYYVETAKAWLVATALAKYWDKTINLLEARLLDKATHNRAIVKASESYRIIPEQKTHLKGLKR